LELPKLSELRRPWFGYPLGYWSEEFEEEEELAVKGDYYVTGEKFSRQRKKV